MRPCSLVLAGAMLMTTIAACGGSDKPEAAAPTSAIGASSTLAATSSTSTPRATTTTTIAATTTAAPTTAAPTTTSTAAPAPGATTTLPLCSENPNAKTCALDTVPLRPDINEILDVYRRFVAEDLKIGTSPDNPDWDAYLGLVTPTARANARAAIQEHFDRGEILNTTLGVTFDPRSTQAPNLPDGEERIRDCRLDGTYWADRSTGEPAAGERAEVQPIHVLAIMRRIGSTWYVSSISVLDEPCGAR